MTDSVSIESVLLYCVFQEGIYRHTCIGVFDSFDLAKQAADRAAREDRDSYHSYDVMPFALNGFVERERDVLYSVRQSDVLARAAKQEAT